MCREVKRVVDDCVLFICLLAMHTCFNVDTKG